MMVLLKLILAHMLGDFVLQPDSWIAERNEKKLKSAKLYLHVIFHGLLVYVLLWELSMWRIALTIAVTHLLIDIVKMYAETERYKRTWFVIDQVLHFTVIALIWYNWGEHAFSIGSLFTLKNIILFTSLVAVTYPASVVIKVFISKWAPDKKEEKKESLENAGKYIGILERLFVLLFVISGHWEAVGFLIAAKSVFRFGDLKEAKDIKLTEYILIGTLMSFGMAIFIGMTARHFLSTIQ